MMHEEFVGWLDKLREAWESKNPELASEICEENLLWYEAPFDDPLRTKAEVLKEWQSVLDHKDIHLEYEVLNINEDFGIAKFSAKFTRISSGEKVDMRGIFQVFLNENEKCVEFHQWYNSK